MALLVTFLVKWCAIFCMHKIWWNTFVYLDPLKNPTDFFFSQGQRSAALQSERERERERERKREREREREGERE